MNITYFLNLLFKLEATIKNTYIGILFLLWGVSKQDFEICGNI